MKQGIIQWNGEWFNETGNNSMKQGIVQWNILTQTDLQQLNVLKKPWDIHIGSIIKKICRL